MWVDVYVGVCVCVSGVITGRVEVVEVAILVVVVAAAVIVVQISSYM